MLLFPSYFWHRTVPFESERERICVAFDVIPKEGGGSLKRAGVGRTNAKIALKIA
jgi:hypothetical protein